MKKLNLALRILLALLLAMPVIGALGFFPEPAAEMYTPEGWNFMSALMEAGYIMPIMAIVFAISIVLLFTGRQALAAVLIAPITVNIITFHWFLDATPVSANSAMAYIFLALNLYLLWYNRKHYQALLAKH